MFALTTWEFRWLLIIIALVASLVISAFRIARIARLLGRSPWRWFFISLFFTAIPATVVFWRDRARSLSAGYAREEKSDGKQPVTGLCPHCGAILDAADKAAGECPRCHMTLDQGHYA
jgi:uncharacterized paraquat-inducible protein A